MDKIWLYKITFKHGGIYIGQTRNPRRRWGCLKTFCIPHSIKKIKFFFSSIQANEAEIALINRYRNNGVRMYNKSEGPGATGCKRLPHVSAIIAKGVKKNTIERNVN